MKTQIDFVAFDLHRSLAVFNRITISANSRRLPAAHITFRLFNFYTCHRQQENQQQQAPATSTGAAGITFLQCRAKKCNGFLFICCPFELRNKLSI